MRALVITPGVAGSVRLAERADPVPREGHLLVEGIAVGICGTDRELIAGELGEPPEGADELVLGHESLGRVRTAPAGSGFAAGNLVAGIVRRPDPEPCGACAHGEFDMCRNGKYLERGIKGLDGYASQVWTVDPAYAVKVPDSLGLAGILVEPTSVDGTGGSLARCPRRNSRRRVRPRIRCVPQHFHAVLRGRTGQARELFLRLLGLCNDVGLLSEQYDPASGRHMGNTPQAFSMVGLVNSARHLSGAATRTSAPAQSQMK